MGKTYFISDLHLGHAAIIRMCNRPFANVDEMNKAIITNWNSVVTKDDDVYILGDVAYKSAEHVPAILNKLNGRKHLIVGNHDRKNLKMREFRNCFVEINEMQTLLLDNKWITLCHYPMIEWDGYFRGSYHIYGHIHNNATNRAYKVMREEANALNAGADITGFYPVTFEQLIKCNADFKSVNK